MGDFKVGDYIRGINKTKYIFTGVRMTKGEVISVDENGDEPCMTVRILEHEHNIAIGKEYEVINSKDYFELIKEDKEVEKGEERKMEESLNEMIIKKLMPDIKKKVMKEIKGLTDNVTTIVVKKDDIETSKVTDFTHKEFKDILALVSNNIPVMLTGGAGSGKSSTCEQVAKAMNLDFYFSNAITQEYKLTGFIDANGKYQETQFYKAFKNRRIILFR